MLADQDVVATAARHVAEGKRIVAAQKERIARLKAKGLSTLDAEQTLQVFETSLAIFQRHRDELLGLHK